MPADPAAIKSAAVGPEADAAAAANDDEEDDEAAAAAAAAEREEGEGEAAGALAAAAFLFVADELVDAADDVWSHLLPLTGAGRERALSWACLLNMVFC